MLHRLWRDGTAFRWSNKEVAVVATGRERDEFRRVPVDSSPCQGEVTAIAWAPLRL
jgi:hypothetical protein